MIIEIPVQVPDFDPDTPRIPPKFISAPFRFVIKVQEYSAPQRTPVEVSYNGNDFVLQLRFSNNPPINSFRHPIPFIEFHGRVLQVFVSYTIFQQKDEADVYLTNLMIIEGKSDG